MYFKMKTFYGVILCLTFAIFGKSLLLPNTTGIDGQLTANLQVDKFFSLWLVFNNEDVKTSDKSFTIFAPKNSAKSYGKDLIKHPDLIKKILLDHIVLGTEVDISSSLTTLTLKTLSGKNITINKNNDKFYANDEAQILQEKIQVPNGVIIILDNYLFQQDINANNNTTEKNITAANLSIITISDDKQTTTTTTLTPILSTAKSNLTFLENLSQVLSYLKTGVRVFQHFLTKSNVSIAKLLKEGEEYTVFVPTDHAFQRWHPIDWGFYPFSVPEFTESVMINHFIRGNLHQDSITDGQVAKTLGGKEVVFHKTVGSSSTIMVNGATIVKGDTTFPNGNILFINEVLFVSESIVSRLHQQHKDKETPPLLAFPWFGAQFLSHAFLALERDKRFTHVTRFLNLADLAPHVSGTGYTFFVPLDSAFEHLGLDRMPDNYLSTGDGLAILLNHFIKGRLYNRDLKNQTHFQTLGNKTITITRDNKDSVIINNDAKIIESEIFVYNLGTMYYIDKILFTSTESLPASLTKPTTSKTTEPPSTSTVASSITTATIASTTINDANNIASTTVTELTESIPEELTDETGSMPDVLITFDSDMSLTTTSTNLSTNSPIVTTNTTKQN